VIVCAFLLIVLPGVWLIGLLVGQGKDMAESVARSPLIDRIATLRIGTFQLGPELANIGRSLVTWLGTNALGFVGSATHFTLNLLLSFFGLYYLLVSEGKGWGSFRTYVPFSAKNAEALRERFRSVTLATVLGTGVTALISGIMIAFGFWVVGLSNAVFWGVIAVIFAILPLVGTNLIWIPGAVSLALDGRWPGAIILTVIGIVAGYVGTPIHSYVVGRYTQIHPMVTLVGVIAGISYFGLLGILIGPLALSYFFEMLRMYREEYVTT
jgi:predicted PurR-regulated permease PerM